MQPGGSTGGGGGAEQLPALGTPLVDLNELLQDSFLRRLSTAFFQLLHEERGRLAPELAQQAQRLAGLLGAQLGWGVGVVTELGGSDEEEDGPVLVLEGEAGF